VGWFFDDECRFDNYSKWWIPYLDYFVTADKESAFKYQLLGANAYHLLVTSNAQVFKRSSEEKKYDVSFVGTRIADRGKFVDEIKEKGFQIFTFGRGWDSGYISLEERINVYNSSKINLCFVKSYGVNTRPQMKDKMFDICMCGQFLLCEYIPGIEEYFTIDKEIVCFRETEEAIDKIGYYLNHDAEREAIAQAGWERAQREHDQYKWLLRIFNNIENDYKIENEFVSEKKDIVIPPQFRHLPSSFHLRWAKFLMMEGFDEKRWQEELDLAFFYDPKNVEVSRLGLIGRLPAFVRPRLIFLWITIKKLKRTLYFQLVSIKILRKIKHALHKCRFLFVTILKRISCLPCEMRLRLRGHGECFKIFSHLTLSDKLLLYKLARGLKRDSVIVEVGSYLGASSTFLAIAAEEEDSIVYCVDTWSNDAMSESKCDTYSSFVLNTDKFAGTIHPLRGRSIEIAEQFSKPIDLLFIDGDHSYSGCSSDVKAWLPKLKDGGVVVFHDFGWAEGVNRTLQEMVKPIEQSPGHVKENIYYARINPGKRPQ